MTAAWLLLASGCSVFTEDRDYGPARPVDVSHVPDAVPRDEPRSRYGNPDTYVVNGRRYHTLGSAAGYRERGIASWYGAKFHGRRTSSGEVYDMYAMTAAHTTLPLPTYARVTNLKNRRSVIVKINDRGPFHPNRIIDLSYTAASKLGILGSGTGLVEVEAITPGTYAAAPARDARSVPEAPVGGPPGLYIQVGAFGVRDNALRLKTRLHSIFSSGVTILEARTDNGPIYRVRVGPLPSVEEADRLIAELARLEIDAVHIVID